MKVDFIKSLFAVAISALLGYALYVLSDNNLLLSIGGGVFFATTLVCALGISIEGVRSMANSKITAWIFFCIFLILNIVFAKTGFKVPSFIILNGIILLVFLLLIHSLIKASKG